MNNWFAKLLAAAAGLLTLWAFYFWLHWQVQWQLYVLAGVYLCLLMVLSFARKQTLGRTGQILLVFTGLCSLVLLSLLENILAEVVVSLIGILSIIYFFLYPGAAVLSFPQRKAWRRWQTLIIVYDFLAILTLLFALGVFLPMVPFWLLAFLVSLLGAYLAFLCWQDYVPAPPKHFLLWLAVFFLLLWEFIWTVNFLPLGYLVASAVVLWPWYVGLLLVRFHLSPEGIVWRRQAAFLIVNFVLYVGLLVFFVKWI